MIGEVFDSFIVYLTMHEYVVVLLTGWTIKKGLDNLMNNYQQFIILSVVTNMFYKRCFNIGLIGGKLLLSPKHQWSRNSRGGKAISCANQTALKEVYYTYV